MLEEHAQDLELVGRIAEAEIALEVQLIAQQHGADFAHACSAARMHEEAGLEHLRAGGFIEPKLLADGHRDRRGPRYVAGRLAAAELPRDSKATQQVDNGYSFHSEAAGL